MKNCKLIIVALFCAVALLAGAAPSARAQVVTEPERTPISTDTDTPVVVKQKPAKAVWLKAEVIHADRHILIVREVGQWNGNTHIHVLRTEQRIKWRKCRMRADIRLEIA